MTSATEIRHYLEGIYEPNIRRQFKLAFHIILLSLVRKSELLNARWEHENLENGEWTIPAERSKTLQPMPGSSPRSNVLAERL